MKQRGKLIRKLAGFDVMTHVLGTVGLRSKLFCRSECSAPWTFAVSPGALSHFHVIERGGAWLELAGRPPLALAPGDLLVIAPGQSYRLVDQPGRKGGPIIEMSERETPGQHLLLQHGKNAPVTAVICGSFSFEYGDSHPVLALLPKVMHLRAGSIKSDASLQSMIQCLVAEVSAMNPGADTVISRLTDILFIHVLRAWLAEQPGRPSWLTALADHRIGPALALIHERPEQPWTVERLARKVGLSRALFSFARRLNRRSVVISSRYRRIPRRLPHARADAARRTDVDRER